jgi:thiol:disulfide interchange protein DsbD
MQKQNIISLLILAVAAYPQDLSISLNNMENPKTELFYSQEFPKPNDTLYFKVAIPQGWHINANTVSDKFLVASSIEPVAAGIEFEPALWPQPLKQYNEILNIDLFFLQDTFTISLPIKAIKEGSNPYSAKLKFTYQACSKICLAPKTIEVGFDFLPPLQIDKKKNSELNNSSFVLYFFLALLGGLILNVMPCVLPALFLKISSLMQTTAKTKCNMFKLGVATTGGIWLSFFVIAITISAIRLTGNAVGWGFQFQYPAYTATLALCIMIFALSIFGVFEFWIPGSALKNLNKRSQKNDILGAFIYGIMLVLLSTPCSAPFLGTAVGFAITASTIELIAIFTAIAIGLSLPYLILSAFPQWTKKLPKQGNWMVVLKQFLGFPLLLTAIWLVWIFDVQTGAFVKLTALFCVAGFFAWLSHIIANPGKPWWRFCCLWLVFILIYVLSWNLWISPQFKQNNAAGAHTENTVWIPFSKEKLDSLQNKSEAVWVNGTAVWCITCQVNKAIVFENEHIKKLFAEKKIIQMLADCSNPNDEALKFFESYGREGVPFDLFLTSRREPILMPEILTVDAVAETLEKAY